MCNSIYEGTIYWQNAANPVGTPPSPPSGGTYNFATNTLTAPTSPTGWTATQPATSTIPTWACNYIFSGLPTATVTALTWGTAYVDAVQGIPGTNGTSVAVINLYQLSATGAPTLPSATTYNFSTGIVASTGLWSQTAPTPTLGNPVYMTQCTFTASAGSTTSTSASTWSAATVFAQVGATGTTGTTGTAIALVHIYQASSTGAPSLPSTPSYNFSTLVVSPLGSWSQTPPTATLSNPVYVSTCTFSATAGSTTSTSSTGWATPAIFAQVGATGSSGTNGTNGTNGANGNSVYAATVYLQSSSYPVGTPPSSPSGGSFNFSSNTLTAPSGGWVVLQPSTSSSGIPTWGVTYTFNGTGTVSGGTWGTPFIDALQGASGLGGAQGYTPIAYTAYCVSTAATVTSATRTDAGNVSLPQSADSTAWGLSGVTWYANPPALSAGQYLWMVMGVYDGNVNTVWNTPFWASLMVGQLSSISANLGTVTAGTINLNGSTANYIRAGQTAYNTGTGFWLDGGGNFSLGNGTTGLSYSAGTLTVTGTINATSGTFSGDINTSGYVYAAGVTTYAIRGTTWTAAVAGANSGTGGSSIGVYGLNTGGGAGVTGYSTGYSSGTGVSGFADGSSGTGVVGEYFGSGTGTGVSGVTFSATGFGGYFANAGGGYALYSNGSTLLGGDTSVSGNIAVASGYTIKIGTLPVIARHDTGNFVFAADTTYTIAHGLGVLPSNTEVYLYFNAYNAVFTSAVAATIGLSLNKWYKIPSFTTNTNEYGTSVWADATNIYVTVGYGLQLQYISSTTSALSLGNYNVSQYIQGNGFYLNVVVSG